MSTMLKKYCLFRQIRNEIYGFSFTFHTKGTEKKKKVQYAPCLLFEFDELRKLVFSTKIFLEIISGEYHNFSIKNSTLLCFW